jgi:hypothetical protein
MVVVLIYRASTIVYLGYIVPLNVPFMVSIDLLNQEIQNRLMNKFTLLVANIYCIYIAQYQLIVVIVLQYKLHPLN